MNHISHREYSCWKTYPTAAAVGVYVVFIITVIFIGVLIVCFTTKIPGMLLFLAINRDLKRALL